MTSAKARWSPGSRTGRSRPSRARAAPSPRIPRRSSTLRRSRRFRNGFAWRINADWWDVNVTSVKTCRGRAARRVAHRSGSLVGRQSGRGRRPAQQEQAPADHLRRSERDPARHLRNRRGRSARRKYRDHFPHCRQSHHQLRPVLRRRVRRQPPPLENSRHRFARRRRHQQKKAQGMGRGQRRGLRLLPRAGARSASAVEFRPVHRSGSDRSCGKKSSSLSA